MISGLTDGLSHQKTSGTRGEPQLVVQATIVWFVESDRMFRNNEMGGGLKVGDAGWVVA